MSNSEMGHSVNRRQFMKAAGLVSGVAGGAGLGLFGYAAGQDPNTYLGWQNEEGAVQTFNRKRFEVDEPTYEITGPTSRPDARVEQLFERRGRFMRAWHAVREGGEFEEPLKSYYEAHPEVLELDRMNVEEIMPALLADHERYGHQFLLAEAWSDAMGAVQPQPVSGPPEDWDFPSPRRDGTVPKPLKMKDPIKTAELIKKVSHQFGSTLVGITRLNPDWVYGYPISRRGFANLDEPLEVPDHWEYAIVVGVPMSWDPLYANPPFGTSNDAYSRSRIIATRVAAFINALGYPSRTHTPGTSYDLMVPPIAIDAGLGQQGRNSIVITPELGCNFRPAVITTNIPMAIDKPIDFGVNEFCRTCKICAEQCPSGSISMGNPVEIRGYRRWEINAPSCNNMWNSTLGPMGCRICVSVCPYTRKANWLHKTALKVTAHDPTGISDHLLTGLQGRFYELPDPQSYYIPSLGGENASYREPPWWLRAEEFIDMEAEVNDADL
jgi:reductive dehalogenase